jgi:hypothetical protein
MGDVDILETRSYSLATVLFRDVTRLHLRHARPRRFGAGKARAAPIPAIVRRPTSHHVRGLPEYRAEKATLVADDAARLLSISYRSQTIGISERLVTVLLIKRQ